MFIFLNRLRKDQGGQGLLFAAFILLVLVAFVLTVVDVGTVVNRKVQAQTAADAAALSGATLNARTLNVLSLMNIGIVACYALIASIILSNVVICALSLVPVVGVALLTACEWYASNSPKMIKSVFNFAKKISALEEKVVLFNKFWVMAEMYRIANNNLTNAENQPLDINSFNAMTIDDIKGSIREGVSNGAIGINALKQVPPDIKDAVKQGTVSDLLKSFLPGPLSKVSFDESGNVSASHTTTYMETTYTEAVTCGQGRGARTYRYTRKSNEEPVALPFSDCRTRIIRTRIRKKNVTVPRRLNLSDNFEHDWPMPYMLVKDKWKDGVRICGMAYRFSTRKAVIEPLVDGHDMIPRNAAFAEATAYDTRTRTANNITLFNPTWDARLMPLSMHKELINNSGFAGLFDELSDYLILH